MVHAIRISGILAFSMLAFSGTAEAKKRKKKNKNEPVAPLEGWQQQEGWTHGCYYPPNFEALGGMARQDAGMNGFDEIAAQWKGNRNDGISFGENLVDEVEIIVLATPAKAEIVLQANLEHCLKSAQGQGANEWGAWLRSQPAQLTEGECYNGLSYTLFQWLEITDSWQEERPVCPDDHIRISGSVKDRYRVSNDGPWITVEGDPNKPTVGLEDYPCSRDGCLEGMLIMKYVTDEGMEMIFPVGSEFTYRVPEKGTVSYQINDSTFYDNIWYQTGGLVDKTSIEIARSTEAKTPSRARKWTCLKSDGGSPSLSFP